MPLSAAHTDAIERVLDDPDILRFTGVPEPPPPGFAATWVARYEEGRREGTRDGFAILGEADAFLGLALAPRIEREAATVELGYLVAPDARGRGVATEALRLLTDWSFGELGAERVELKISSENEPSKKVAERCGYVHEGVLRNAWVKPGVRADVELWSRLRTDA